MTACSRPNCSGALFPVSDEEPGGFVCALCARRFVVILGRLMELKPQIGKELDHDQPAHRGARR